MNDGKNSKYTTDHAMPPYLYGRPADPGKASEDQRIAVHLPEPEYAPDLQVLKESDPDSYRMVIYSWA